MGLSTEDLEDAAVICTYITKNMRPLYFLPHWEQTSTKYNLRRNRSQWLNGHKIDLSWICNVALRELVAAKIAEAQMAAV